ncbi:MAG: alpha/beta hydrolase [Patescibacteria group bacterium]
MKVIVNGLAIEYESQGEGRVILMLHGWGNTMHYFDALCSEIKGFQIVRLDLPGFGGSETPQKPWTVEVYARFVARFCEKLHIEPALIIGHSFGGRITAKGVSQKILNPQKIVLIASAGVAHRRTARNIGYTIIAKVGKLLLAPFPKGAYNRFRYALYRSTGSDYLTVGSMSETFLHMIREDLSNAAAAIKTPTLLIWGEDDAVTPVTEGKKLNALIPNSRLYVVPSAGHFVHKEKPKEVAELIRGFI